MKRLALFLMITCAAPAFAQSKAELAANDARLAQRLTVLESRMLTGDPAAERILQRLDAMETTVRNLTGEVEQLRFQRDNLQNEIKAMADSLRQMEQLKDRWELHLQAVDMVATQPSMPATNTGLPPAGMPPFGTVSQPSTSTPSPLPGPPGMRQITVTPGQPMGAPEAITDVSGLPDRGRSKLAEGKFAEAETAFAQYIAVSPGAPDIGDAQFWLGESRYVQGRYAEAAESYIASMKAQARGPKAPEAMVRLGASLRELGKTAEACQTLNAFGAQYPNADAGVKAKAQVERQRTGC